MTVEVKVVLVALLFLALACFAAWSTTMCARSGVLMARGVQVSRSENPIQFWILIAIGYCGSVMALLIPLFVAMVWIGVV